MPEKPNIFEKQKSNIDFNTVIWEIKQKFEEMVERIIWKTKYELTRLKKSVKSWKDLPKKASAIESYTKAKKWKTSVKNGILIWEDGKNQELYNSIKSINDYNWAITYWTVFPIDSKDWWNENVLKEAISFLEWHSPHLSKNISFNKTNSAVWEFSIKRNKYLQEELSIYKKRLEELENQKNSDLLI